MTDRDLGGAELARGFFLGVVEPLLGRALPGLGYAAARLGSGSDVLGLDDGMSRDHDWGCRLTLLVDEDDRDRVPQIRRLLEEGLPERYREFPVRFPVTWDASVSHQVEVATVAGFAASRLGVDPTGGLSVLDWLTVTGQSVLEVTAGPVFTDRTRALAPVRALLAWYPPDVERYVLAAGWRRLCQLMPMVGRTAESGDELGSRLLAAKLAGDLVWLAFASNGPTAWTCCRARAAGRRCSRPTEPGPTRDDVRPWPDALPGRRKPKSSTVIDGGRSRFFNDFYD